MSPNPRTRSLALGLLLGLTGLTTAPAALAERGHGFADRHHDRHGYAERHHRHGPGCGHDLHRHQPARHWDRGHRDRDHRGPGHWRHDQHRDHFRGRFGDPHPAPRVHYYQHSRSSGGDRYRVTSRSQSATPAIVGGIIGGVVGNQIGKGRGRDAATVAGVILGASVGHDLGRH